MNSMIKDIKDFHDKFQVPSSQIPVRLSQEAFDFRVKFMQEELNEYIMAAIHDDLAGQLDALVDLVYVALGTAHIAGLPFQAAWDEVHGANMRKERAGPNGEGSKRGSPLDVIKPKGWQGPDYSKILP